MEILNLSECLNSSRAVALFCNSPFPLLPSKWQEIWCSALFRCATDGAANHLRPLCETGLKLPNLVSGDFDSIRDSTKTFLLNNNVEVIETSDQDNTDLTKLLKLIIGKREIEWDAIFILGGFGGRFDHTLASLNSLVQCQEWTSKPVFIFDHENITTVLPKGHTKISFSNTSSIFSKSCGIVPIMQKETIVTLKGFQWNLEKCPLEFGGIISTSNTVASEEVEIKTNEYLIFTLQTNWKNFKL